MGPITAGAIFLRGRAGRGPCGAKAPPVHMLRYALLAIEVLIKGFYKDLYALSYVSVPCDWYLLCSCPGGKGYSGLFWIGVLRLGDNATT